MYVKTITYI